MNQEMAMENAGCVKFDGASSYLRKGCVLSVGRDPAAAIVVRDKCASRQHIALVSLPDPDDCIWIVDTSETGTLLFSPEGHRLRIKHEGVVIKGDFSFLVGADAVAAYEDPDLSPKPFEFTLLQGEQSLRPWLDNPIPWNFLPSTVKDLVEHIPTRINLKAFKTRPELLQPQEDQDGWRTTHCHFEQAFSIFDMFKKKPLPVQTKDRRLTTAGKTTSVSLKKRRIRASPLITQRSRTGSCKPRKTAKNTATELDYDFNF